MGTRHNVMGYDYPDEEGMVWRQTEGGKWFQRPCEWTGHLYAPFCRPLSPCAHRLLEILREPEKYERPYKTGWETVPRWVPITLLHYEAGKLRAKAMEALREIEERGIRLELLAVGSRSGAAVRLA